LNTFIRSFGATPAYNEDGDHIGGITGFLYSVGKVVRDLKPTRCIIVFDGRGGSAKRKKIYSNYKANRDNKKLGEILPNEYSQSSLRTAATALKQ
jgi:5'-3' exonuclease